MKIRNTFLLAVLLLFVSKVHAKGASLNSLIEELAPIARLTNGIAIETELSADANKMNDVVAEFLRVGSGDDVAKLKELRVDEVAKELGELYATVEKVPELNVDMAALADTFKALEHMKQGSKVLEKNVTDPSDELQKDIDLSKNLKSVHFTSLSKFKATAEILNYIKSNSFDSVGEVRNTHLIPLQESVEKLDLQLPYLVNFKQNFQPLMRLEAISEKLRNISEMSTVSRHFTENFKSFSSMAANLDELKTGVGNLKSVVDIQQSIPEIGMDIDEIVSVVKMITSKSSVLRLTVGFPGGVDDVKLLLDDVSSSKFKKILSRGKDTKILKKALKSLENFHSTLKTVTNVWSPLAHSNQTVVSENVAKILATMSENGQKTPDTTALSKSLELMEKCFVNLKLPSAIPDYSKVDRLVKYAADLSARINVFQKFLEQQKSTFEAVTQKMVPLSKILKPIVADLSNGATKKVWNEIRNFSDTDSIIASLSSIHGEFTKVQSQDPFITLEKTVEFQVIPIVLDSMKGTNVDVMLECLQKNNRSSADLDSTLNFEKSFQVMKSKKKEVESIKSWLTDIATVKTGFLEVQKLTLSVQKPPSRRRRAPNSQSLANLKNAPTVAADLGKGVQVLREFAKILENEASVQVAVNADDGLKNAISAIPGVQSVWTDENRKGMGKMVMDLKELDKFAGRVSVESIKSFGKIFEEAGKVRGVDIDAKLFDDPISKALFFNFDWNIYPYHQTFHSLKDLQLNFTQHHEHLKAASLTLDPLQKFFDDFFEIDRSVKEEEGLSTVALVIIICGSIVGVILLILLVKFLVGRWKERRD